MGVLTVTLVELLNQTRLLKEDAAIGIVFPALFSIAVILISRYAQGVHLDTDVVLLGELAFAPFDRSQLFGFDLPHALVVMGTILLLNLSIILLFYKELKLATFDAALAATLGFSPVLIHYGLMTMVSITAVGAFDAVGSILVIALMIAPPAAAYLLTDRLPAMLGLSGLIGVAAAISGYWLARWLDASIAGSMASMAGVIFGGVFLFAPQRGLTALALRRMRQKWEFAQTMLAIHLFNHEGTSEAKAESRVDHLWEHLRWQPDFSEQVIRYAERKGTVSRRHGQLSLTERGRVLAEQAIVH
jgi:manganese/zinc/iron transport system permease protein